MPVRRTKKAGPRFVIRRATDADLDTLTEQRVSIYREIFPGSDLDFDAYGRRYKKWARRMMRRKVLISFVVTESSGKAVAGGSLWIRENQPSPRYPGTGMPYLMSMYTEPEFRGMGLASLVVKGAIAWAREHHYPRMNLHASEMGEPVYAKLGFERTTEMRLILSKSIRKVRASGARKRRRSE